MSRVSRSMMATAILAITCGRHPESVTPALSADQVYRSMLSAYSKASEYRDHGTVTLSEDAGWTFLKWILRATREKAFTTLYTRSRGLQFDFVISGPAGSTWSVTCGDSGALVRKAGLVQASAGGCSDALARLGPVTGASSVMIPPLLIVEDATGPRLRSLLKIRMIGSSIAGGVACYVLRGVDSAGAQYTLWVTRNGFLIKRIRQVVRTGNNSFVRTFEYERIFAR